MTDDERYIILLETNLEELRKQLNDMLKRIDWLEQRIKEKKGITPDGK